VLQEADTSRRAGKKDKLFFYGKNERIVFPKNKLTIFMSQIAKETLIKDLKDRVKTGRPSAKWSIFFSI